MGRKKRVYTTREEIVKRMTVITYEREEAIGLLQNREWVWPKQKRGLARLEKRVEEELEVLQGKLDALDKGK